MSDQSVDDVTNSYFPYKFHHRLHNFTQDKITFIPSQNAFISFKNDLIFITRIIDLSFNLIFNENSSNLPSYPLFKTNCIIKTSHSSVCGHYKCTCINQFGNLLNFTSNSDVLVLYFTNNLIVKYKLNWLPIDCDIGVEITKILEFKAKRGALSSIAIDNTGDLVSCAYFDSTILIYNKENVYRTFNVKNVVILMKFNENNLFCSSNQGDIYIYFITDNLLKTFQGHNSNISDFCFLSFDNTRAFLSSSLDSIINLYKINDKDLSLDQNVSPIKQFILSNSIIGINVINTGLYKSIDTNSPWLILAITENYTFELIDPVTSKILKKLEYGSNVKRVFFSKNFFIVFTNSNELEFYTYNFNLMYGIYTNFDKCYYSRIISNELINTDLNYPYFLILCDERVRLVAMDNLQVVLYSHKDVVLAADILQGSKDGVLKIYNIRERRVINSIIASKNSIVSVCLCKQSGLLNVITADYENILKIWSINGELLHITVPHKKTINHITVSPNHKIIATSGSDKIIKLFNNKLELLGTCTGHNKSVNYSIFIEKDMVLVSCSNDALVKCWNVKTFECIKTFQGHENSILILVQLDDFFIASSDIMGFIKIWSLKTSLCYHTIQPHSKIWYMSLDLPYFITCGEEDSIILWKFTENVDNVLPYKEKIKDQMEVDSYISSNNYVDALYLSIKLNLPSKSIEIINKFSEYIIFNNLSSKSNDLDDKLLDFLSGSDLINPLFKKINETKSSKDYADFISSFCRLIKICISNSKISNIGNLLLNSLLKHTSFDDLSLIFSHLNLDELALLQSKHYSRIFQMAEKSCLLDLLILDCGDVQVSKTMEHLSRN